MTYCPRADGYLSYFAAIKALRINLIKQRVSECHERHEITHAPRRPARKGQEQ
jgi:hypothetical protein